MARSTGTAAARRRRRLAAAAAGTALALVWGSVAFAEGLVGVGESAEGSVLAVSTTGTASSSGGVAVSAAGTAWTGSSSAVGVSALGRADGNGTNVSGEAVVLNTGILDVATTAEQAIVPLTDTIDPLDTANKLQTAAELTTVVAYNMATGLTSVPSAAPQPTTTASCPDGRCYNTPQAKTLSQSFIAQERWYYCVPASAAMLLASAGSGSPGQDELARRLGTSHPRQGMQNDPQAGTPYANVPAVVNNIRRNGDRFLNGHADDAVTLMDRITTDVHVYNHSLMLETNPSRLSYWSNHGTHHAVVAYGYDHRNGGRVWVMDPYDYTRFGWNQRSWGGPNPGGAHVESLPASVWPAVEAEGGNFVW